MALDLHKTAPQIGGMSRALRASRSERAERLRRAAAAIRDPLSREAGPLPEETFVARVEAARPPRPRVTWLVAGLPEGGRSIDLAQRSPLPPIAGAYTVVATDGSQIDVDRHGPAHCFLINVGGALIRYGLSPAAELFSQPALFAGPEQMVLADPEGGLREQPIDGVLLGVKRMVMECEALAERVEALEPGAPALALLDGSLVLWELSGARYPDHVRGILLQEGLLAGFDRLREAAAARPLAFASYISSPRSTEVANVLRVAWCPHEGLESRGCDAICGAGGTGNRECDRVAAGLMDRDIFSELLEPGDRSALFASRSPIVLSDYGRHEVRFCYLNVGAEIARLEMPEWVAGDKGAVDLLHALVMDQCRKGRGYPVALQEAHERAVVTAGDRRVFWEMVEESLAGQGVPVSGSEKARSKRLRAV